MVEPRVLGEEELASLYMIEVISREIAGDIGTAWALYEMHMNTQTAIRAMEVLSLAAPERGESGIVAELVADIAEEIRFFRTPDMVEPCLLRYAILDQFLRLVRSKRWFEALPLLDLSRRGRHIICARHEEEEEYPFLMGVMAINRMDDSGRMEVV